MSSINIAWEEIFGTLDILESLNNVDVFKITAKQINEIGKKEARLMAKFDTKISLPTLFKKNGLNINAISNGTYLIFKDENHKSFAKLPDYRLIKPEKFRPTLEFDLQTLIFNTYMSESSAIDYAHHSRLLSDYIGEGDLKLTTRGRFFSCNFNYSIKNQIIEVDKVQIEVDAGYETRRQFLIIEAKSSTRETFNIRQLYYPYKHFHNKTNKNIRTLLLSFSNGVYYISEFRFGDNYYDYEIVNNSAIEIQVDKTFVPIPTSELLSQETYESIITVPQADDLNKVIDLVILLSEKNLDKFQIADYFEFNDRQGDYYGNAGKYIGLITKIGTSYSLTKEGKYLANIKNRERRNLFASQVILRTKLFNDLYKKFLINRDSIDFEINNVLLKSSLNSTTSNRRAHTIKAWLLWLELNLTN